MGRGGTPSPGFRHAGALYLGEAQAPSNQNPWSVFVHFNDQFSMVRMKSSEQIRLVALLGLGFSLTGCVRDSAQAAALGCYQPTIGPAPTEAATSQSSSYGTWVKLDSSVVPDAEGAVFKLRTQANPPTSLFVRGWWRPIARDSVLVGWATPHPGPIYRLRVEADGLTGTGTNQSDSIRGVLRDQAWVVKARRVPCDAKGYEIQS